MFGHQTWSWWVVILIPVEMALERIPTRDSITLFGLVGYPTVGIKSHSWLGKVGMELLL